jgi:YgiT-type zinc finger domain-containing protein
MEKGFQEPSVICPICLQAEVVNGFTSVEFERAEIRLAVKNVPARVCPQCGEAFLGEDTAAELLRGAQELSVAGLMETEFEFRCIANRMHSC